MSNSPNEAGNTQEPDSNKEAIKPSCPNCQSSELVERHTGVIALVPITSITAWGGDELDGGREYDLDGCEHDMTRMTVDVGGYGNPDSYVCQSCSFASGGLDDFIGKSICVSCEEAVWPRELKPVSVPGDPAPIQDWCEDCREEDDNG